MDNNSEVTTGVQSGLSALIRRLLASYRTAETPQSQRDFLLQLKVANEAIALTEPVTHFDGLAEVQELSVSTTELAELISGYRANLTRPDEKVYLARIRNCVLRAQVIDGDAGAERLLRMLHDLQQGGDHLLVLM
jgi:hypothetical protein